MRLLKNLLSFFLFIGVNVCVLGALNVPQNPRVINFLSGSALTGSGDETGGFGDVIANVQMAFEQRKRFPNREVNLIITNLIDDTRNVTKSFDIVSALYPELVGLENDQARMLNGVNFIRVDMPVAKYTELLQRPEFAKVIPQSDIVYRLSASGELGDPNTPMQWVVVVKEPLGNGLGILPIVTTLRSKAEGQQQLVRAGARGFGYYLQDFSGAQYFDDAENTVQEYLRKHGYVRQAVQVTSAYSKEWDSTLQYIEALKLLPASAKKIILITKAGSLDSVKPLPENLVVIQEAVITKKVADSLVMVADLPPLVTGDVSFSTALSVLRQKDRLFIYERNKWKDIAIRQLQEEMQAALPTQKLKASHFNFSIAKGEKNLQTMQKILSDANTQNTLIKGFRAVLPKLDMTENLEKFRKALLQTPISTSDLQSSTIARQALSDFLYAHLQRDLSWAEFFAEQDKFALENIRSLEPSELIPKVEAGLSYLWRHPDARLEDYRKIIKNFVLLERDYEAAPNLYALIADLPKAALNRWVETRTLLPESYIRRRPWSFRYHALKELCSELIAVYGP